MSRVMVRETREAGIEHLYLWAAKPIYLFQETIVFKGAGAAGFEKAPSHRQLSK